MSPGWSNCSSARLMSVGIFQLLVSSLVGGVVPVMLDNITSQVWCANVCVWILNVLKHYVVLQCLHYLFLVLMYVSGFLVSSKVVHTSLL